MSLPEVHLVGGSCAEALRLAPVAIAMREQGRLTPILLAAGADPAAVERIFQAFGLASQITLPTGDDPAEALRRFDSLWASRTPAAVVVRDTFAAAAAAAWRRIPIMQIDAGRRAGDLASGVAGLSPAPADPTAAPTGPAPSPAAPTGPTASPTGPTASPTGPAPSSAGPTGPTASPTGPATTSAGPAVEAHQPTSTGDAATDDPTTAGGDLNSAAADLASAVSELASATADLAAAAAELAAATGDSTTDADQPAPRAVPADAGRRLMAQFATVHLAATPLTAMNLLDEHIVAGDVLLTGSTVADAAQTLNGARRPTARTRRPILIGVEPARSEPIAAALRGLTDRFADLEVILADDTLPCVDRFRLLAETYLVVTDDEDLAEEALAAGVPVLVPGDSPGHTEALHAGSARLSGPQPAAVAAEVAGLLNGRVRRDGMAAAGNPYGDGLAAYRVAQATAALLGHGQFPDPMPARPAAGISR